MKRLKVALLGLGDVGAQYLSAICSDDRLELVAVADANRERLRLHSQALSVPTYEDYRLLIVESTHAGLDLLFVALEPFQSIEFVELAATGGLAVFHKAPFARNVGEAQRLVSGFDRSGKPLAVSRFWQFEPAFAALSHPSELLGEVYAATATVWTAEVPGGWRTDPLGAGSGVLLRGAYETVDMLVCWLGIPETVYARCGTKMSSNATQQYHTEDVAIVSLGFPGGAIAGITAHRRPNDPMFDVVLLGTKGTATVTAKGLTVVGPNGDVIESRSVCSAPPAIRAIDAFVTSQLEEKPMPISTARDHLGVIAVIEAAYLSARTGTPESPGQLLN